MLILATVLGGLNGCTSESAPPDDPAPRFAWQGAQKSASEPVAELLADLHPQANLYGALSQMGTVDFWDPILERLENKPGTRLLCLTSAEEWNEGISPGQVATRRRLHDFMMRSGQFFMENDRNPWVGQPGRFDQPLNPQFNNFFLVDSMLVEDGKRTVPAVIFFSGPVLPSDSAAIGFVFSVYGDPGMYEAYFKYWTALSENHLDFERNEFRSIGPSHDLRAWFYPREVAIDPAWRWLDKLDSGVVQTGQPVRMRIVTPSLTDLPELEARLKKFMDLEADVKVLSGDTSTSVPNLNLRTHNRIQSSFALVDGPFINTEGMAERRRFLVLGQPLYHNETSMNLSSSLIRIREDSIFSQAEQDWLRWWRAAE